MKQTPDSEAQAIDEERNEILSRVSNWLETPMLGLGFAWLGLLIWELTRGLSPFLEAVGTGIWLIFILSFALEFVLAPRKKEYLKGNWLTVISLVVPALRVFRFMRVFRAARGLRLVKVVGSLNRGMRSLGASFGRRGFGYVMALTAVVVFAGAAGMYAFERNAEGGLQTYGEAVWWTAMIMTTLGSQYWPETPEGRVLCVILALYAFAIFGYVTATLATFFVGRDAENHSAEIAGARSIEELKVEIILLRSEIRSLKGE